MKMILLFITTGLLFVGAQLSFAKPPLIPIIESIRDVKTCKPGYHLKSKDSNECVKTQKPQ